MSPVNPNATQSTRDVVNWLAHLPNRLDNKVTSGFFGGYSAWTFSTTQLDALYTATGQYPGIFGADYGAGWATADDPTTLIDYSCNGTLETYWNNGGLVTISVHYPSPGYANGGNLNTHLSNFADLLNPATDTGARWRAYLDKTAQGLAALQTAGVTVLWRPFHEMNGSWFWWGTQDANTFKNVWIDMYNYFTTTKGLNNLIWVYAPDFGPGSWTSYYPGAAYVDMVGLDVYDDNPGSSVTLASAYNSMTGLGKTFAFTEIGPDTQGSFDYYKWANAFWQKFRKATYFYAWNDGWAPQSNQNSWALMNDPWIVNRGEISLGSLTEPVNILYDFEGGSTQSWNKSNVTGGPWSVTEWWVSRGYTL
ncbi:MAG: glycosyl hydrolase, partial [Opitutaceae bacterium]